MGQTGSVPSLSNMLIRLELKLVKIASRVRLSLASLASVPRFHVIVPRDPDLNHFFPGFTGIASIFGVLGCEVMMK